MVDSTCLLIAGGCRSFSAGWERCLMNSPKGSKATDNRDILRWQLLFDCRKLGNVSASSKSPLVGASHETGGVGV
jgi:hypothetical protein